jgi:hypothetical protein
MTFLLLCIQSLVCVACVATVKQMGIISFRDFDMQDAKAWFPISFTLVSVIYTGSKSLVGGELCSYPPSCINITQQQFLSIPFYTIFKNLTIIIIVRLAFVGSISHSNHGLGIWGSYLVWWACNPSDFCVFRFHGTLPAFNKGYNPAK